MGYKDMTLKKGIDNTNNKKLKAMMMGDIKIKSVLNNKQLMTDSIYYR